MAYIIQRNSQFYVVAYDGIDPRTTKERRRWHPAGTSRADAQAIAERLTAARDGARERTTSALTVREYLLEQWMPRRHRELRPSTAKRYEWMIRNCIVPAIGSHRLSALRAEHLDRLYIELLDHGGTGRRPCLPRPSTTSHVVIRSALRRRGRPSPRRPQRRRTMPARRASPYGRGRTPRGLDRVSARTVPCSHSAPTPLPGPAPDGDDGHATR